MFHLNKKQEFLSAHKNICRRSKVYSNILQTIGNTPLVKLNRIPIDHGLECEMYAKCEYMNPGGSIKDRIAKTMILDAEESGRAKPGTRFVEPTSGNTGIGVALAAAVHGYGCTIVTPDKNSHDKMNTMRLLGAQVIETPAEAFNGDPENFMSVSARIIEEDPYALSLDQYSNIVNPLTHYETTAAEILSAVGHVDMMVMGTGTGGTAAGIGHRLKEKYPDCIIVAVDPQGSVMFEEGDPEEYLIEGIGGDFVPNVLDKSVIDRVEKPNDLQSFNMAREVIIREGLLCGGSSGAAMYAAINAAKELKLGAGKRVVVIFPDGIRNYMTKFVSDQWMEAHLFKSPPQRKNLLWWNQSITHLKINRTIPRIDKNRSCWDALNVMGFEHGLAFVVNDKGYLRGVISKDGLRCEATNPKNGESIDMNESISKHLVKKYYKIIVNKGDPTIGLVSRILDITPYVVVVEKYDHIDKDVLLPKGLVTAEHVLNHIVNQEKYLH